MVFLLAAFISDKWKHCWQLIIFSLYLDISCSLNVDWMIYLDKHLIRREMYFYYYKNFEWKYECFILFFFFINFLQTYWDKKLKSKTGKNERKTGLFYIYCAYVIFKWNYTIYHILFTKPACHRTSSKIVRKPVSRNWL